MNLQTHETGPEPLGDPAVAIRAIVLLYEAAIGAIESAAAAAEADDGAGRCRGAERAFGIVAHLYGCLDMERGGEVAANLARSYRLVLARLVRVSAGGDAGPAREAIRLLLPLLEAWRQLETAEATDLRAEASAAASAAYAPPASAAA